MNPSDLKNNLAIGKQLFTKIPESISPLWALLILSRFDGFTGGIPEILDLYPSIQYKHRWKNAKAHYGNIHELRKENTLYSDDYLHLAELVAMLTFNASGEPSSFDKDCGHLIPSAALKVAEDYANPRLDAELISSLLIFDQIAENDLPKFQELLFQKDIDDILWFFWDPSGVNDNVPGDTYRKYVPEILSLALSNANLQEITDQLFFIETEFLGSDRQIHESQSVAEMILDSKDKIFGPIILNEDGL